MPTDLASYLTALVPDQLKRFTMDPSDQARETGSTFGILESMWMTRNQKMDEWNKVIRLDNYLWHKDMESFISNAPKSDFNLASQLLATASIPHKVDRSYIDNAQQEEAAVNIERAITYLWKHVSRHNRRGGRKIWMREFGQQILSTGWYSVFVDMLDDRAVADIWSPYDVFPLWDDDLGLVSVIHRQNLAGQTINLKLEQMGLPHANLRDLAIYPVLDHFKQDYETGMVMNGIITGSKVLKPWMPHPEVDRIPVLIGPVGGMPDRGILPSNGGNSWTGHIGESIVETNLNVQRAMNRQMSYLMQTMRDTANPRWIEKAQSETHILNQATIFKRGAIFRMSINEDVDVLPVPPIPVEVTTSIRDVNDMLAKGGFPNTTFGLNNLQQSAVQMRTVIEASSHVLGPFIEGMEGVLSDIDEIWANALYEGKKPYGIQFSKGNIPAVVRHAFWEVKVHPKIPGDLANRAAVGRQLNPDYVIPSEIITEYLYPEIPNPARLEAMRRSELALRNPKATDLMLVLAYEQEAEDSEALGDTERAQLFRTVSGSIRTSLGVREEPTEIAAPTQQVAQPAPQIQGQEF